jgi:hypothetical protein
MAKTVLKKFGADKQNIFSIIAINLDYYLKILYNIIAANDASFILWEGYRGKAERRKIPGAFRRSSQDLSPKPATTGPVLPILPARQALPTAQYISTSKIKKIF